MANRVLAHTKRLFRWAAGSRPDRGRPGRAHREADARAPTRPRARPIDELVAVWRAAATMGGPFGAGVQMLIATGARREEVFALERKESRPLRRAFACRAARSKVNEPRIIPLSPLAISVLDRLPGIGPFVFSSRGRQAVRQLQLQQGAVRRADRPPARRGPLGPAVAARGAAGSRRRAAALALARSAQDRRDRPAAPGRAAGGDRGRARTRFRQPQPASSAVYQRHRFEAEAREALVAWGAHVQRLIDGDTAGAEVVPLRRA